MADDGKIRITADDLRDPMVDDALAREKQRKAMALDAELSPAERKKAQKQYPSVAPGPQPEVVAKGGGSAFVSSATLYTAVAGALGALVAWGLTEFVLPPVGGQSGEMILLHSVVWLALIGALVGAAIGSIEGVASRAPNQAIRSGSLGFFIGMAGCGLGALIAQAVYFAFGSVSAGGLAPDIIARAAAWGIAGLFLGLAQGLAMLSARKALNGLIGGLLGGIVGGILFDPLGLAFGGIQ